MSDLISRQAAIDALACLDDYEEEAIEALRKLPSAQPEYRLDEWCTECKEYDHERHCCPRFNHVIRTTLQEVQAEQPEIIRCKDCKHYQFADNRAFGMPVKMCEWFGFEDVDDYDFCSRAERRGTSDAG